MLQGELVYMLNVIPWGGNMNYMVELTCLCILSE